ncbi:MAG: hypothetical protein QXD77_00555 [Candidatus Aenigmatarchaeota archaeon]
MKMLVLTIIIAVTLTAVPAFAEGPQGGLMSGQGVQGGAQANDTVGQEEKGASEGQQVQEQAQTMAQLREMIRQREQELNTTMKEVRAEVRSVYENQNRVRLAVHAMLAMENLEGGIGKNVSVIARQFNNSVQSTLRAEERIAARNAVWRLLFGGDENAASEMLQQTEQNRVRLQELRQLRDKCDCTDEVKAELGAQIQAVEQEQERLRQLARNELQAKGLFGWLFK